MRFLLLPLVLALVPAACKKTPAPTNAVKEVDIPRTPTKFQGGIGFCWAYTTVALLEEHTLRRTGKTLDLSEEAIGFYRMLEELEHIAADPGLVAKVLETSDAQLSEAPVFVEGLNGSEVEFAEGQPGAKRFRSGLALAQRYGVVPESAWSKKFADGSDTPEGVVATEQILKAFKRLLAARQPGAAPLKTEDIVRGALLRDRADASDKRYDSAPPESFELDGKTWTAKALYESLGFDPSAWQVVSLKGAGSYDTFVRVIKEGLAMGSGVPIEFPVVQAGGAAIDFATSEIGFDPRNGGPGFEVTGQEGHVVLLVDFVSKGSRPGAVPDDVLRRAVAAPASELDYVVAKNSWPGRIGRGDVLPRGTWRITSPYLEKLTTTPLVQQKDGTLFVVVPKEAAERGLRSR